MGASEAIFRTRGRGRWTHNRFSPIHCVFRRVGAGGEKTPKNGGPKNWVPGIDFGGLQRPKQLLGVEQSLIRKLCASRKILYKIVGGGTGFDWAGICIEQDLLRELFGRKRILLENYVRRERSVCKTVGVEQSLIR